MLSRLIEQLRCTAPLKRSDTEMAQLLDGCCVGSAILDRPLAYHGGAYTRTCAYYDDDFEVLLLNWAPGSQSAVHDHGGQHCWFMLLEGQLRVDNFQRTDSGETPGLAQIVATGSDLLGPGDLDVRSKSFDIHRVAAVGNANALSLHVYARPLREFLVYDASAQRCSAGRSVYHGVLPFR